MFSQRRRKFENIEKILNIGGAPLAENHRKWARKEKKIEKDEEKVFLFFHKPNIVINKFLHKLKKLQSYERIYNFQGKKNNEKEKKGSLKIFRHYHYHFGCLMFIQSRHNLKMVVSNSADG